MSVSAFIDPVSMVRLSVSVLKSSVILVRLSVAVLRLSVAVLRSFVALSIRSVRSPRSLMSPTISLNCLEFITSLVT